MGGLQSFFSGIVSGNVSVPNLFALGTVILATLTYVKRKTIIGYSGDVLANLKRTNTLTRQNRDMRNALTAAREENRDWHIIVRGLRERANDLSEQLKDYMGRITEIESLLEIKSANEIALFEDRTNLLKESHALRDQIVHANLTPCVPATVVFGLPPGVVSE